MEIEIGGSRHWNGLFWIVIAIGVAYSCAQPESVTSWAVETCGKACAPRGIAKVTDAECSCVEVKP